MTAKLPKDEVQYGQGMLHSHCGEMFHDDRHYCRHFKSKTLGRSGECEVVAGAILRDHWCDRYKRMKGAA